MFVFVNWKKETLARNIRCYLLNFSISMSFLPVLPSVAACLGLATGGIQTAHLLKNQRAVAQAQIKAWICWQRRKKKSYLLVEVVVGIEFYWTAIITTKTNYYALTLEQVRNRCLLLACSGAYHGMLQDHVSHHTRFKSGDAQPNPSMKKIIFPGVHSSVK